MLGLPGYGQFYKGKPITTMTYDFWHGRRAHTHDGTRFTLQEIFLSSLTNFLYDDGRSPGGRAVVVGPAEEAGDLAPGTTASSCWRWSRTPTTAASTRCRPPAAARSGRTPGPVAIGLFDYTLSEAVDPRARARRTRR